MISSDTSNRSIELARIVMEYNRVATAGTVGSEAQLRAEKALSDLGKINPRLRDALFCAQCDEFGELDDEEYPMPASVAALFDDEADEDA